MVGFLIVCPKLDFDAMYTGDFYTAFFGLEVACQVILLILRNPYPEICITEVTTSFLVGIQLTWPLKRLSVTVRECTRTVAFGIPSGDGLLRSEPM
jgi:hypothetical protein